MELEITNFPDEILSGYILKLIKQTKENIRLARDPYYKKDIKKEPKRIILSNSAIYI
jgi:hypothetical protein|tara:strand:+ start:4019 stop:4189 length:171 start_codon:yes stop_codon:yes gene_type:complete